MLFLLLALASAITFALIIRAMTRRSASPFLSSDHILLVIAHPDDESLFFSPAMLRLSQDRVPTSVLCLSNGNADGLGAIRTEELYEACSLFSIPHSHITIIDDPLLQDGMDRKWDVERASRHIRDSVDQWNATAVLTFDNQGVSGHPNHISTFRAVIHSLSQLSGKRRVRIYALESVGVLRKFCSLMDLPSAFLLSLSSRGRKFIITSPNPMQGWAAMMNHKSQLVWYRYLFLLFSTYTVFNVLVRLDEAD